MSQVASECAEVNNLSNNSKCLAVIHQLLNTGIKTNVLKMTNGCLYKLLHFVARIHDMLLDKVSHFDETCPPNNQNAL